MKGNLKNPDWFVDYHYNIIPRSESVKRGLNLIEMYTHKTGTKIKGFSSHKEHCFYEETTKRQMFLIIEQLATRIKGDKNRDWVEIAEQEKRLLKLNNIK